MKGFRFYAEMPENRLSKKASKRYPFFPFTVKAISQHEGEVNVCAIYLDDDGRPAMWNNESYSALAQAIEGNKQSYCHCSVSPDYLHERCTRIPESVARKHSPELFRILERENNV